MSDTLKNTVWHYIHVNPAEYLFQISNDRVVLQSDFISAFLLLFKAACQDKRESPYIAHVVDYIIHNGIDTPVMTNALTSDIWLNFLSRANKKGLLKHIKNKYCLHAEVLLVAAIIFELDNLTAQMLDALHIFAHSTLEIRIEKEMTLIASFKVVL